MKFKKSIIITLFLCLLLIGSVSATSDNDTTTSDINDDKTTIQEANIGDLTNTVESTSNIDINEANKKKSKTNEIDNNSQKKQKENNKLSNNFKKEILADSDEEEWDFIEAGIDLYNSCNKYDPIISLRSDVPGVNFEIFINNVSKYNGVIELDSDRDYWKTYTGDSLNLNPGKYYIKVILTEKDKKDKVKEGFITYNPTNITYTDIINTEENGIVTATFALKDTNGKAEVYVNSYDEVHGKTRILRGTSNIVNGITTVEINGLNEEGYHTLEFVFSTNYGTFYSEKDIQVIKNSKDITASFTPTTFEVGTTGNLQVTSKNTVFLEITVDGEKNDPEEITNSKTISFNNLTVGTHIIQVTEIYQEYTKLFIITVTEKQTNPQQGQNGGSTQPSSTSNGNNNPNSGTTANPTTAPSNTVSNTQTNKQTIKITAPTKTTFKTKTKTKKYTVTLKNKNKPIKKATVKLTVKGKKYTVRTNNKGKATFKITNLKKKGKYTAIITYKGIKRTVKIIVK